MVKEGISAGIRQSQLWTDSVIVGGSQSLQTAGAMVLIEASGTAASISGQNIYVTGSVLTGRLLGAEMVSGTDLFATGSLTAGRVFFPTVGSTAGSFFGAKIVGGTQLSGLNIFAAGSVDGGRVLAGGRRLYSTGLGSPTTYGQFLQAGSAVTNAASIVWAVFGTGFSAVPSISAKAINTGGVDRAIGIASITAGSFYAVSIGAASINFMWQAVGTP